MEQIFYIDLRAEIVLCFIVTRKTSLARVILGDSILRLPEEIISRSFKTFVQIGR